MMVLKNLLRLSLLMIFVLKKKLVDKKLGEKLYQFALDYATEQECYNATLHVWNDNQGALDFYEHLGVKPRYTEMKTILK